jgi:excisionase family DNA binding protein
MMGGMASSEPSPRHLLTVGETAERLNVSVTTIRRRIWDRELPCLRIGSGPQAPIRVDPADLEDFLHSARREPPADEAAGLPTVASRRAEEDA